MTKDKHEPEGTGHEESAEWSRVRSWAKPGLDELSHPPISEEDRERRRELIQRLADGEPVLADLQQLGIPARSLDEFANLRLVYPDTAPVLIAHLAKDYPEHVRWEILLALQRPYGAKAYGALRDRLLAAVGAAGPPPSPRELNLFGYALAANASKANIDDLLDLAQDSRLGIGREALLLRVARWVDPRVRDVVLRLFRRHEAELEWPLLRALRLQKLWSVADEVEPYLRHAEPALRAEARAYIRAMEAAKAKGG